MAKDRSGRHRSAGSLAGPTGAAVDHYPSAHRRATSSWWQEPARSPCVSLPGLDDEPAQQRRSIGGVAALQWARGYRKSNQGTGRAVWNQAISLQKFLGDRGSPSLGDFGVQPLRVAATAVGPTGTMR